MRLKIQEMKFVCIPLLIKYIWMERDRKTKKERERREERERQMALL
jgi:hypothetical protein